MGRYEEAINDYNKVIELNPKDAIAYYTRGNAKLALGRHQEAIMDYDKAIELNPQFAIAYYTRGDAKSDLGRHEEAITDYDKAKTLYAEAGNVEMAEKCKEKIARLKKH